MLSPALAIMLRDAGLQKLVVGRHGFDLVLPASLPVCGDQSGLDYEAIVRCRPTHVLIEWGQRELPRRLDELSRQLSFKVLDFELNSVEQIATAADELERRFGAASGNPSAGSRMLESIGSLGEDRSGVGRVLLLGSCSPPSAIGPDSFHAEILRRIGAIPVPATGARWIEMDSEDVLRLAPDVIILVEPRSPRTEAAPGPSWDEIVSRLGAVGQLDVPAVRNRRVAVLDDPLAFAPATSLAEVAREMAGILDRWRP
ncbi:MAG: hypothetical protein H6811_07415 [Phycisphaeraceae bacterium]|nr:hypothetical protein [Phycisphaeraceae bacterium]